MITMTIHYGEEIQQRKLPCDFLSLRMSLYQMNLLRSPHEVSVRDVQAEFTSYNPLGQKLISLIRPGDLLSDVDVAIHQIKAAPQAIQNAMRQNLMDGCFKTIGDIQIGRDKLLEEMCGYRQIFYFPLTCSTEDDDGELHEDDTVDLSSYLDEIQDALEMNQARDVDTMAMFFWTPDREINDSIRSKILTCVWNAAEIGGTPYGQVTVTATEPFTEKEVAAMKEWICGQNSDGLGEGFEDHPIETEYGDIYVHFWHSGDDYYIITDNELDQELHTTAHGIDGDMTGMSM